MKGEAMNKTDVELRELYFQWLLNQVCSYHEKQDYERLFRHLFIVDFRFSIERDENRAADGIDLRRIFAEEYRISFEERHRAISGPCSVLEMLVALSKRADTGMFGDKLKNSEDEANYIFWLMMKNIGLVVLKNGDFSPGKANRRLDVFMDRKYAPNGSKGGLFVVSKPRHDLREVEIWYQMCWYFSETLGI